MASTWSASLNRGLGAEPPAGSGGQAAKPPPPETESFLALRTCNRQNKFVSFAVFSAVHYNKIERCKIRAGTPR